MPQIPLGPIKVTTPGTLVQATVNLSVPANRVGTQSIMFQVIPGNAGVVYIGTASMVRATGVGVLAYLPKPTSATTGPFTSAQFSIPVLPAGLNATDYYIDADTGGDGVVASITVG